MGVVGVAAQTPGSRPRHRAEVLPLPRLRRQESAPTLAPEAEGSPRPWGGHWWSRPWTHSHEALSEPQLYPGPLDSSHPPASVLSPETDVWGS